MSWNRRIAVSVCFAALTLTLVVLWVRSYRLADRLHGRLWGQQSFIIAAKYGQLSVVGFRWHGARNFDWRLVSYPVGDELAFPWTNSATQWRYTGFDWLSDPPYNVMRFTQTMPDGTTARFFGAAVATLHGGGPMMPFWFLVCLSTGISVLPWWSSLIGARRYSLRMLLIVTTLICVALGLGVWLTS